SPPGGGSGRGGPTTLNTLGRTRYGLQPMPLTTRLTSLHHSHTVFQNARGEKLCCQLLEVPFDLVPGAQRRLRLPSAFAAAGLARLVLAQFLLQRLHPLALRVELVH